MMWKLNHRLFTVVAVTFCLCCFCVEICDAQTSTSSSHATQAIGLIMGEDVLAANAIEVCRRSQFFNDEQRYRYLADWVFPSSTHQTLRLKGDLLATASEADTVVAPVFDLLKVARKLNRLPELRTRLEQVSNVSSNEQQRARLGLQVLLAMESGNDPSGIEQGITTILQLIEAVSPTDIKDVWPETIVAAHGLRHSPSESIGDLLQQIKGTRSDQGIPHRVPEWHGLIFSLNQQFAYQQSHRSTSTKTGEELSQWSPISRLRGYSQGSGFSRAQWKFDGIGIEHVAGNDEDYLLYQSPLLGDYAVDYELPSDGQTQFYAGGNLFGPHWIDHLYVGEWRHGTIRKALTPPLNHLEEWVHCRVEFRGATRTWMINGRTVQTDTLTEPRFPWIGHHSWGRNRGRLRDVRITGQPTIPGSIPLVVNEQLQGWHSYHEVDVGSPTSVWRYEQTLESNEPGVLVGTHQPWLSESLGERLLMYQRPLREGGAIEYEFLFEPGRFAVFPTFDRLAFLVDSQRVSLHQITDDLFDRTGISPDNVMQDPGGQLQSPPLRVGEWNHMRVEIAGQIVTLKLNGKSIYQRELETTNSRQFGFFYFIDNTAARVRNVVMSGNWDRELPNLTEQEFANRTTSTIDTETARILPVFDHHFSEGLPNEYFTIPPGFTGGTIEATEAGLECKQRSAGPVSKSIVRPRFEVRGDFDVRVRFADWDSSSHDFCGASLELVAESGHRFAVTRRVQEKTYHWGVLEWAIPRGNGQLQSYYQTLPTEASGGSLRVVRQGDVWHALIADHDSSIYRIIGTVTMEGTASKPVTFDLAAVAGERGRTEFTWKEFRLAANEIFLLPDASQASKPAIFMMNSDGSDLKRMSRPEGNDPGHGSPDWSADGKQLSYDSWRGGAAASRIFLMNTDGTNNREVGAGSMPTFAPDGKRLAFSGAEGISIMQADGTGREVIGESGWGAQWSPDGDWISYGSYRGANGNNGANIAMTHVKTRETRYLLQGEQAKRYSQVYWNMEWSPDSQKICFKGALLNGGTELAITDVAGSSKGFTVLTTQPVETDLSWHPDGKKLLLPMPSPEHLGSMRLFECDIASKEFTYLKGQPNSFQSSSAVWSPDGLRIAFVTIPPAERVPWKPDRQE